MYVYCVGVVGAGGGGGGGFGFDAMHHVRERRGSGVERVREGGGECVCQCV